MLTDKRKYQEQFEFDTMTHTAPPPKPHSDSNFKQQKMVSFIPQHAPSTMSVALLVVAIVFIPIGAAIVVSSDSLLEVDIRYDHVNRCNWQSPGVYPFAFNGTTMYSGCNCKRTFTLTKTISAPVYIYYRLTNFHQNYRQYQASRDDAQLQGGTSSLSSDCAPFRYPGEIQGRGSNTADGLAYSSYTYNPCGAIPWSKFNDSISLYKIPVATSVNVSDISLPTGATVVCVGKKFSQTGDSTLPDNVCSKKGIAFKADTDTRFSAPQGNNLWKSGGTPSSTDPYLAGGYYAFEPGHAIPLTTDEDFIVWARTASMPDFHKLYRIINKDLTAGDYLLDIEEYFDTSSFDGEKHVVLATRSWIGGKNYVLGISLIVMGSLSFVLAIAIIVLKCTTKK